MVLRQRVRDGRVLCARDGTWNDVETCYGCPAFKTTYQFGAAQTVVCKPELDRLQGTRLTNLMMLDRR